MAHLDVFLVTGKFMEDGNIIEDLVEFSKATKEQLLTLDRIVVNKRGVIVNRVTASYLNKVYAEMRL